MSLEKKSPCKINLILNILGRRQDGFHELETVMFPVPVFDDLYFDREEGASGVYLSCSDPALPTNDTNLVYRAAHLFLKKVGTRDGVTVHLEKRIPMGAGLGGGSGNAATTLLGMNELFDHPFGIEALHEMAASLGSDIPFFLQTDPALATGRGEKVESLEPFNFLQNKILLLVYPGFGVSTPWAYQQLARFPEALQGEKGRAGKLIEALRAGDLGGVQAHVYNSLERPVLEKFPLLDLYQQFLKEAEAEVALMSGSGSSTFALFGNEDRAVEAAEKFRAEFNPTWTMLVRLG